MKKLILSVFMFALIAGASVNSTANAPVSETSGIAMPHLIYCLSKKQADGRNLAATAGGAVAVGWGFKLGYGVVAIAGLSGIGIIGGLAVGY